MNKTLLALLISGLLSAPAFAFEPFKVRDIRVEGIQRTEAGTVFSYLPVKVGETMTEDKAAQAIKALFATGFFKDVRVEVDDDVLVVSVVERPAIAQIDFVGMKEFDKDTIKKALKEVGIAESRIFDRALLDKAEQELKRQYLSKGKYGATITTTVTPLERNRVSINFNIVEGEAARIKKISVIGASFKEKELLSQFELTTPGWLTWYTKNDQYSKQKLMADQEKLRSFYLNRGYLEFNIESTQVSISPDKKDVYITMNVAEGDRYQVSSVKLAGDLVVPEAELRKLVTVKPGDVFSREQLNNTTKAVSDRLGVEGYAFANVNAAPEVDKQNKLVAFTIFVDPGKRVYVRRVNVTGNTKTRDEVIRRELRQMESGWYDADAVSRSKERVDKLGYFSDVSVETPSVPGTADQVDINVNVTEKPTGAISLGAGVSQSEGLILSGSISQDNIFGSGKHVAVQLTTGSVNRVLSFSYTDPYFTPDGISQGFDVYHKMVDVSSTSLGDYKTTSTGGGIRFGFPIDEKEAINVGMAIDVTTLKTYSDSPASYIDFVDRYGDTNVTLPATTSWVRDTTDSSIWPTRGGIQKVGLEVGLPGVDMQYYKMTYKLQQFIPLSKSFTLMGNMELGKGNGYNGKTLPFYKNFYAGGIGSVRGYQSSSLGPTDATYTDSRIGGNREIVFNGELLFGIPGFDHSLRLGLFADAGNVFGAGEQMSLSDLRASTGISLSWISPVGPLKFSIAQPLNSKDGDKTERVQFQLGTTF
jgi:outer membrane protein insertion porin family